MNIELDNYYVTRELNTVLAKERIIDDQTRMCPPEYMKTSNRWFGVCKEGNYYISKSNSFRDIMETLEDKTTTYDLHIIDLFQLVDFTMNKLYTTAEVKDESVKVNYGFGSELKIYHPIVDATFRYPVVSVGRATSVSNKISKLHKALDKALEGF